jgi:methyltransferase (TIGR00027 family)
MDSDSGPSATARRVAAYRLGFTRPSWPSGDAAADDALARDLAAAGDTGDAEGAEGAGDAGTSRMHDHLARRTAFFDRVVLAALSAGVRQLVTGAAGYDGRSLRYATPGVRWFEVDHPATQRDKLARLTRLGIEAGQVRFVPADFAADQVADRLLAAGLVSSVPALFLLEGVAVYLPADVLVRVLSQFSDVAGPGSELAISMPVSGSLASASRFREAVAALGEPAQSRFTPASARAVLAEAGWLVTEADGGLLLAAQHL